MSEEQREAEEIRQEKIEAGVGKIVPGAGRRGTSRRMDQMVSVRLSGDLIARLKIVARQRGTTLSELVREGAELIVEDEYASVQQQRVMFRISGAQQAIHETISERTVATH